MEGYSSRNLRPRAGLQHPPPSTPLCQPHKVLQGREIAPIHILQTAPPQHSRHPNPSQTPPASPQALGGGGSLPALPSRLLAVPEPLWQPCRAGREGGSSQRLPGRRARGIAERAQAQGDRQTDTGRKETPPPYSTLARAEASPAQSEGGRQIQSAMSSCCCRRRWRTADV